MAADTGQGTARFGRLFNYANNPITIAGVVLTTLSAIMMIVFMIVDVSGGFPNPYVGLLAYVTLPALFVIGLLEIPVGMLRRRNRLRRHGKNAEEIARFPTLDFNDARVRRVSTIALGLTCVNAVILGSASFLAVHEMETVEFCGETCHTVMQPEFTAYQESPHSRIACVQCHIGPGASWFVRSKLDGLRQVWHTVLGDYSRPIETPLENLRPARETCEQCHWPNKHHGDKLRVFARFATDEANTPSYTAMLLKTGGGAMDLGRHGGIHWWHIYSDNRIRFIADDERKEEISWVELVTADGEVRRYTRDGGGEPVEKGIEAEAHLMDCIDCHNRPTHLFESPTRALDRELEYHPDLRVLPYFKKQALAVLQADYPTHGEGVAGVRAGIVAFYKTAYPDLVAADRPLVEKGANRAAAVFARSIFPAMATDWRSHPNHIGHDEFPGCWRCHDDELTTADGEHSIPMDCENCHLFLVEDAEKRPDMSALLLE